MAMVLINWLYIAVTTFLTGYGILSLFAHLSGYRIRHTISYFLAGLTVVTVYAQFFSLFFGVAVWANLLLIAVCLLIVFMKKQELTEFGAVIITKLNKEKWKYAVYLFLILLMAYGTSRGYMHFDTGLYHAQSIRWIEEYGVVPGLANIQARFGYNSAAFVLTALYSMKEIFGQSLHTTAGFFVLLGSFMTVDLYKVFTEKRILLSDFVRIGLVFYISVVFSQMMSPASDYYAQILLFVILILWIMEDEHQKKENISDPMPYGLLCVLIVYAVTIKFSVVLLLLLVIKPAVMLLKKHSVKEIFCFLTGGLLTSLPFFIRNVIISGWLVYPFAGIDLFNVDWKIPKGQVQYDAMEIGVYGRGIDDVTKHDMAFGSWFPNWFTGLKALEKVWVLLTAAAVLAGFLYTIWKIVLLWNTRKKKETISACCLWNRECDFLLVFWVLTVSTAFWFISAPLVRYGYAYVTVMPLLTFGSFFLQMMEKAAKKGRGKAVLPVFCVLLIAFLLTRVKGFAGDIMRTWKEPYYFAQTDYEDGEAVIKEVDGVAFYVPVYAGQIGYQKFPSSVFAVLFELRGDSLEEGFRQITAETK